MRRFTFVGRLGVGDVGTVPIVQTDSTQVAVQFVGAYQRLDYGLGAALDRLKVLGRRPDEKAIDFILLAALVNAADTRVSRLANSQNGWTREIDVIVPVSDPTLWRGQADLIADTLRFLTGDHWRIFFRDRPTGFTQIAKPPVTLPLVQFDDVCLFSGGLDSLIGAINLLSDGRRPILMSHWWDSETSKAQRAVVDQLERHFPNSGFKSIRVRLGFDKHHVHTGETENSQRGRSLVFFALATLVASSLGASSRVVVPENGLIGLNVPLDPLRLGALSTRTTHPHYMTNINRLLHNIGLGVTLENPYRHKTKGEMVRECADMAFLRVVAPSSMSCSSPAKARYKGFSPRHCGTCVPCLIRRASLEAGLGVPDQTLYLVSSLTARRLNTARAEGEHIRSFELMAAKLQQNPQSAGALARIPGPLNDAPQELGDYVEVFRRGILEVKSLLDPVRASPA